MNRLVCLGITLAVSLPVSAACRGNIRYGSPSVPVYTYQVINVFPHDAGAYTQGLVYHDGFLYESTGRYGQSSLRKVDLATGRVIQIYRLPREYWGEGIAINKGTIIQLTWQSRRGFIYDLADFSLLREFSYPTEGWGITPAGGKFIMSDGTAGLYYLDAQTLEVTDRIQAHDKNGPVRYLNELENVNGELFANVWGTDSIAIIDPSDGSVTGWIDLSGLLATQNYSGPSEVLNGIACDPATGRIFVTGKLWPYLFEIRLIPLK